MCHVTSCACPRVNEAAPVVGENVITKILRAGLGFAAVLLVIGGVQAAETAVKVGILNTSASGAIFVAIEKGYFAAEGIAPELVVFDAAQPIAVAAVTDAIDFGVDGVTAALYTLAGQGALRIIAGCVREMPGFHTTAFIASNAAYEAGLRTVKDMPGHTVAISQMGSAYQYALNLLGLKYGFTLDKLQITAVQSLPNIASAVAGGKTNAGVLNAALTLPLVAKGDIKLLSWVGDETPWQTAAVWTSAKTANGRRDLVERFLRAYKKGARDFHDAFTGPNESRADQPTAPEIAGLLAKYLKLTPAQIQSGISYHDPEARFDMRDLRRQLAWYEAQGLMKGTLDAEAVVDRHYLVELPEH